MNKQTHWVLWGITGFVLAIVTVSVVGNFNHFFDREYLFTSSGAMSSYHSYSHYFLKEFLIVTIPPISLGMGNSIANSESPGFYIVYLLVRSLNFAIVLIFIRWLVEKLSVRKNITSASVKLFSTFFVFLLIWVLGSAISAVKPFKNDLARAEKTLNVYKLNQGVDCDSVSAEDRQICINSRAFHESYLGQAQATKNERLCESGPSQTERDVCYHNVALRKLDKSICKKIMNTPDISSCEEVIEYYLKQGVTPDQM